MFTQCPECKKNHTLTIQQLRNNRGLIQCSNCSVRFDALQSLSNSPEHQNNDLQPQETIHWRNDHLAVSSPPWGIGVFLTMALLVSQLVYFEGDSLVQNPRLRPWLNEACQWLNCHLPVYRNPTEFTVLHSSFAKSDDRQYSFQAALNNQAEFAQNYPKVKLKLLDFSGRAFAERTFYPDQYLPLANSSSLIAGDETFEINLHIAAPKANIGGYSFEIT